jgi:hypothetical protein
MENQNLPLSLRELQLWMKWIITDPRGVQGALSDPFPTGVFPLGRYTSPAKSALRLISETPQFDQTARLDIYAEAYFSRILDSMKADFPITLRVLGELSFQKLLSDYLKVFPSRTFNIGEVGRNFSKFAGTYEDLFKLPFLESLVDLEWLAIESFYAIDTQPLDSSRLTRLTEKDWSFASFKLAPSCHLLSSVWSLDHFWELRNEASPLESSIFERLSLNQGFLLGRENNSVFLEPISPAEFLILKTLRSGVGLADTLELVQESFPDRDFSSQLMTWFNDWVRRGVICDLVLHSEENER